MARKKSYNKCYKDEFLFTDEKLFGDDGEHAYDVKCYDGWGIATPVEKDDPALLMTYPTMEEVLSVDRMPWAIIEYRYFGSNMVPSDLLPNDVAIKYAKLVKLTKAQLKALAN